MIAGSAQHVTFSEEINLSFHGFILLSRIAKQQNLYQAGHKSAGSRELPEPPSNAPPKSPDSYPPRVTAAIRHGQPNSSNRGYGLGKIVNRRFPQLDTDAPARQKPDGRMCETLKIGAKDYIFNGQKVS